MTFIGIFFLSALILSTTEIFLLLRVASSLGFLTAMALCVFTGVVGAFFVKRQGISTLRIIQMQLALGKVPTEEILSGALLLVAGALLFVPGFITDGIGFSLLVPQIRKVVVRLITDRISKSFNLSAWHRIEVDFDPFGDRYEKEERIIDAEFEEKPGKED